MQDDTEITPVENEEAETELVEETAGFEDAGTASDVYTGSTKRKVYSGMWGPLEIVAVAAAGSLLLLAFAFYLVFVVPAENELASGRKQRDELDRELQASRLKWGDIQDTESQVAKLLTSSEDFEFRALKDETNGTTAVYQRINVLLNAYGLRNTSGPDYVPLNASESGERRQQQGSQSQRGRDKFRSIYPGIYITTTVEGSYSNLRRFIRDIESSQEFVAITALELEPSDEQSQGAETQTVQVTDSSGRKTSQTFKKGRYRGTTVSLRIEMAAYFRRPGIIREKTAVESADGLPAAGTD